MRNIILFVITLVSLVAYGLSGNFAVLLCLLLVPVLYLLLPRGEKSAEPSAPQSVDELLSRYDAEPDAVIVADATRGNEPQSVVVFFRERDLLIAGGQEVRISDVVDVTFNNATTPYMVSDYQIILTLSNPTRRIHISTGHDAQWAAEVMRQVREACGL